MDALLLAGVQGFSVLRHQIFRERGKDGFRGIVWKTDRDFPARKRSGRLCAVLDGWCLIATGKGNCSKQLPFVHVDRCYANGAWGIHVRKARF